MTKKELRSFMRQQKGIHVSSFPLWSAAVCQKVVTSPLWQQAHTVLLYHALPDEPDLQPLLDAALSEGKHVLLPVVEGDDLLLKNYEGRENLRSGSFGILEPSGQVFPMSRYTEIDLALIPGMAFDREGHRLGRGRGYYDRMLPRIPQTRLIGICFPFQFVESVPTEPHDFLVDVVVFATK